MKKTWDSLLLEIGLDGHNWIFPPEAADIAKKNGQIAPLDEFLEKLRSGEDMPASAAAMLADIIEGNYRYKFELVAVPKNIAATERGADAIGVGLEMERFVRDKGETISSAVILLAEYFSVDDRTIWRCWREYKSMYPNGLLEELERLNKPKP